MPRVNRRAHANAGDAAAGAALACDRPKQKIYKKKKATTKDLPPDSLGHRHNPLSLPEGVQLQLHPLPVRIKSINIKNLSTNQSLTTDNYQRRIYKKKKATTKDLPPESSCHRHKSLSLPEGVHFQVHPLPVRTRSINIKKLTTNQSLTTDNYQRKIYKKKEATASVLPLESSGHRPNPSSLPEGVQFQLHTLPVNERCIGDGDGFTAFVEMAVPLNTPVDEAEYKTIKGSDNKMIVARKYRIRMRGIDAPELEMEYGEESRIELMNLIKNKCLQVNVYGNDRFGRYVGDIFCDGVFIQEEMLKRGFAWHFKTFDNRIEFGQWESAARASRQGLWLSDNPKKPWEWRREQRNADKQNDIQMHNVICEALSRLTKEKEDAEETAVEWQTKCEFVASENKMLNDQLRELKQNLHRNQKAFRQLLNQANDQLQELEKEHENNKLKQLVKQIAIGVGTSVGVVVLFRACKKLFI